MAIRFSIPRLPFHSAICAWGIATACTSSVCIASWTYHIDGMVRIIANAAYMVTLPGWIPLYVFGLSGIRNHPVGIIAANAIAWSIWITFIWFALHLRTKQVQPHERSESESEQLDLSRRRFLANATLGTVTIGAIATPGYATLIEPWSIKVRRYTIPIKNLNPAFEGLKIENLNKFGRAMADMELDWDEVRSILPIADCFNLVLD